MRPTTRSTRRRRWTPSSRTNWSQIGYAHYKLMRAAELWRAATRAAISAILGPPSCSRPRTGARGRQRGGGESVAAGVDERRLFFLVPSLRIAFARRWSRGATTSMGISSEDYQFFRETNDVAGFLTAHPYLNDESGSRFRFYGPYDCGGDTDWGVTHPFY